MQAIFQIKNEISFLKEICFKDMENIVCFVKAKILV